jgi:L-asparaginase/Glu-tRNA(Gln) amidotransferase subunit D
MTTTPPKVNIVATGGSIAGIGPNRLDYVLYPELGGHLTIAQSLDRIPEVANIAQIEAEDLISVGSTAIGPQDWLRLAQRINQLLEGNTAGVVITHGTATLEETAYFLHLTVKSTRPVVVTGAMRPQRPLAPTPISICWTPSVSPLPRTLPVKESLLC